jgi:arthrofactin-type cyclic lipopeptide synthetase C
MVIRMNFQENLASGIQATCVRQGRGMPLFLIHSGYDHSFLALLSAHVDADMSIYCLSSEVKDRPQMRTIEGMAMWMIQRIRVIQPTGPYCVVGHSFGGILAYEVAVLLLGADERIAFLGLLDARYDPHEAIYLRDPGQFSCSDSVSALRSSSDSGSPEEQQGMVPEKGSGLTSRISEIVSVTNSRMSQLPVSSSDRLSLEIQTPQPPANLQSYADAIEQYSPQTISIPIHVFSVLNTEKATIFWRLKVPLRENQVHIIFADDADVSITRASGAEILGQVLSVSIRGPAKDRPKVSETGDDPIVALQTGQSNMTPLICVPGAGASVVSFLDLVTCIHNPLPICGIEPRGLDGAIIPHSTIEVAAQSYLKVVGRRYQNKAIHLFGHSFGGWVVFELAKLLLETAIEVASVTILDTEEPDNCDAVFREFNRTDVLMKYVEICELLLERPLRLECQQFELLDESAQRECLHRSLVNEGVLPRRSKADMLLGPLTAFAMSLRTTYVPDSPYPKKLRLITVDNPKLDQCANRKVQEQLVLAWRRWAPNLVYSHAPGNHMTVLKPPNVRDLARILEESISIDA